MIGGRGREVWLREIESGIVYQEMFWEENAFVPGPVSEEEAKGTLIS